jgi:hypothetical protein
MHRSPVLYAGASASLQRAMAEERRGDLSAAYASYRQAGLLYIADGRRDTANAGMQLRARQQAHKLLQKLEAMAAAATA